MSEKILVTGATGAIGRSLVPLLRDIYGKSQVIAGYHTRLPHGSLADGPCFQINVADKTALALYVKSQKITTIYHLAALLSVAAENDPDAAEQVNTEGLRNVLDVLVSQGNSRLFWASSIAVYGKGLDSRNVAEDVLLSPITVYGRGKVLGEKMIADYCRQGLDARIIRFPGLNGPGKPGPGTTEYAIEMIQTASVQDNYTAPLRADTIMPMMDMRDAVRAIIMLMQAQSADIGKPYNIAAYSFSPDELTKIILEFNPRFLVEYRPDKLKQRIADSWPDTVDDSRARRQWNWKPQIALKEMVRNIFAETQTTNAY